MNQNEKVVATAERDRCWADLRGNAKRLSELLLGAKDVKLDPLDFLLFYQCIIIVLAELEFFEEEFPEEVETLKKDNAGAALLRTLRDTGYWKDMVDEKLSVEKRLKAIEKLRKSTWSNMFSKKDEILELQAGYPDKMEDRKMHLMMQCVAIVGLELDLKRREIELIDS